ncbi:MAG: chemotaxis protein CheW [Calditrichia bacterium]
MAFFGLHFEISNRNLPCLQPPDMVVLLDNGQMAMGILADRIHGVRSLNDVKIKPAHGVVSKTMEEFVTGVMSEKSSMIYILDIERLFSSPAIRTYF